MADLLYLICVILEILFGCSSSRTDDEYTDYNHINNEMNDMGPDFHNVKAFRNLYKHNTYNPYTGGWNAEQDEDNGF